METWPSGTAPGSGGTGGTWSHPWCAGANSAIIRLLVGVQPIELGWERWIVAPQPSSLPAFNATVPLVRGDASVQVVASLVQTAAMLQLSFTVPEGTAAKVCLPPPHGLQAADAPTLTLDHKAAGKTVADGRMLCLGEDVTTAGQHVVGRSK